MALSVLPSMECRHHFLGVQRNRWRWDFRLRGERVPDVFGFRAVQMEQEDIERNTSVSIPSFRLDSVGALVFDMGPNQLALAGSW